MQNLADHWATEWDWRRCEAMFNQAPRSWTEQAHHNLIYFNEADRGGHFAAWEQPQLFSEELRSAFRSLR